MRTRWHSFPARSKNYRESLELARGSLITRYADICTVIENRVKFRVSVKKYSTAVW